MPNHVCNLVTAPSEVIDRLLNERGDVDFEKIIPTPECIRHEGTPPHVEAAAKLALGLFNFGNIDLSRGNTIIYEGMQMDNALRQLKDMKMAASFDDLEFGLFVSYMRSYRECGHTDWYSWNCANWGTKWNAYDTDRISPTEVRFSTAWSAPHPVIEELATETGAEITHEWADEDTGHNVGIREYGEDGYDEHEMSGTKEGYELAFKLNGGEEYYELVDGQCQYKEEEY